MNVSFWTYSVSPTGVPSTEAPRPWIKTDGLHRPDLSCQPQMLLSSNMSSVVKDVPPRSCSRYHTPGLRSGSLSFMICPIKLAPFSAAFALFCIWANAHQPMPPAMRITPIPIPLYTLYFSIPITVSIKDKKASPYFRSRRVCVFMF